MGGGIAEALANSDIKTLLYSSSYVLPHILPQSYTIFENGLWDEEFNQIISREYIFTVIGNNLVAEVGSTPVYSANVELKEDLSTTLWGKNYHRIHIEGEITRTKNTSRNLYALASSYSGTGGLLIASSTTYDTISINYDTPTDVSVKGNFLITAPDWVYGTITISKITFYNE